MKKKEREKDKNINRKRRVGAGEGRKGLRKIKRKKGRSKKEGCKKKKKKINRDAELAVSHVAKHLRYSEKQVHLRASRSPTGTFFPDCSLLWLVQLAERKCYLLYKYM